MAITLPLPFRVAAGILGTGIDLVRSLPDDIPALPVTLVGNAMKLSIKVQQEIATLATRGDELLGGVIGGAEENPAWAKFDDDEPLKPARPVTKLKSAPTAGSTGNADTTSAKRTSHRSAADKPSPSTQPGKSAGAGTAVVPEPGDGSEDEPKLTTPEASSMPPVITTAMDAAIDVGEAVIDEALVAVDDSPAPDPVTLEEAVDAEVVAGVTEALEEAIALEVAAEVTEALEDAVALEVAAEVTEALEDSAAQGLAVEATDRLNDAERNDAILDVAAFDAAALEDETLQEAALEYAGSEDRTEPIDPPSIDGALIDPEDFTENPVVFEETGELTETLPVRPELREEVVEATEAIPDEATEADEAAEADGPDALPDYDQMTLAQVRGHLRELSSDAVSALLRYEQDGDARPPFLTLLSNRLVTLDAQSQ